MRNADPVGYLRHRAAASIAEAARFRDLAVEVLDLAMEKAIDELPRVWIPMTATESLLLVVAGHATRCARACDDAAEAIKDVRIESELRFLDEMAQERQEKRQHGAR